jgi:RNA-binding protein YhbY
VECLAEVVCVMISLPKVTWLISVTKSSPPGACRSLVALLSSHVLVKVRLNGDPSGTMQLAEHLEGECAASLVYVKGNTILLAQGER